MWKLGSFPFYTEAHEQHSPIKLTKKGDSIHNTGNYLNVWCKSNVVEHFHHTQQIITVSSCKTV